MTTRTPFEEDFEDIVYYIIQEIQQEENEHNNDEETLSIEDENILVNKIYNGIFTNYIIN